MKILTTYIIALLPGLKHTQAILPNRSANLADMVSAIASYCSALNLSWAAIGHYICGVLRQAFKDSLLSENEMDFLLLTIAGYWLMTKTVLTYYIGAGRSTRAARSKN